MGPPSHAVTGTVAGVMAGVAFGGTTVLSRSMARDGLGAPTVLTIRFGIGGGILALLVLLTGRSLVPAKGERLACFLLGAVGYAIESSLFFAGLQRGSAAAVTIIFYTYPAIVTAIEVVAGLARLTLRLAAAIVLAGAGTAVVVVAGGSVTLTSGAVAFTLSAAVSFALYLLASHRLLTKTDRMVGAAWASGGAAVGLAVRYGLSGGFPSPAGFWPRLVGLGATSAAAFGLLFFALGHIGAARSSIVLNM
ncbi:MAG: DMT family transporter, partial [Actinomycetota bacterium]|nr:DMT family transporter [Actinomycetota bacterium]